MSSAQPLVQDWLNTVDDHGGRLELTPESWHELPELVEAYSLKGLETVPQNGSVIERHDEAVAFNFEAHLCDPDGEPVGLIHRRLDTAVAHAEHEELQLPADLQGDGRGKASICAAVELYLALGLEGVSLYAGNVGSYVWAQCGFDFADPETREDFLAAAEELFSELGFAGSLESAQRPWDLMRIDETVTLKQVVNARVDGPMDSEIPGEPDSRIELGKALLLASPHAGWHGVLDLEPKSPGRVQLARYAGCHGE